MLANNFCGSQIQFDLEEQNFLHEILLVNKCRLGHESDPTQT